MAGQSFTVTNTPQQLPNLTVDIAYGIQNIGNESVSYISVAVGTTPTVANDQPKAFVLRRGASGSVKNTATEVMWVWTQAAGQDSILSYDELISV